MHCEVCHLWALGQGPGACRHRSKVHRPEDTCFRAVVRDQASFGLAGRIDGEELFVDKLIHAQRAEFPAETGAFHPTEG